MRVHLQNKVTSILTSWTPIGTFKLVEVDSVGDAMTRIRNDTFLHILPFVTLVSARLGYYNKIYSADYYNSTSGRGR